MPTLSEMLASEATYVEGKKPEEYNVTVFIGRKSGLPQLYGKKNGYRVADYSMLPVSPNIMESKASRGTLTEIIAHEARDVVVNIITALGPRPTFDAVKNIFTGTIQLATQAADGKIISEDIVDGFAKTQDAFGSTPLILLARTLMSGDLTALCMLGEKFRLTPGEMGLDARDNAGRTALHYAAALGQVDAVEALLSAGANPYIKDNDGKTPFALACSTDEAAVAKMLVDLEMHPQRSISTGYNSITFDVKDKPGKAKIKDIKRNMNLAEGVDVMMLQSQTLFAELQRCSDFMTLPESIRYVINMGATELSAATIARRCKVGLDVLKRKFADSKKYPLYDNGQQVSIFVPLEEGKYALTPTQRELLGLEESSKVELEGRLAVVTLPSIDHLSEKKAGKDVTKKTELGIASTSCPYDIKWVRQLQASQFHFTIDADKRPDKNGHIRITGPADEMAQMQSLYRQYKEGKPAPVSYIQMRAGGGAIYK